MKLLACLFLLVAGPLFGRTISTDGTQSAAQSAANNAAAGDIISVPNGTFTWNGTLTITKAITLTGSGSTTIKNGNAGGPMISASAPATGNISIQNLVIVQAVNNNPKGFMIAASRDSTSSHTVLIHDCKFDQAGVYEYSVECRSNGIIFYNCEFIGSGNTGIGGISFVVSIGDYTLYNQPSTLGTRDTDGLHNTYVEDCTFRNATNMANFDANSRVVLRHCLMDEAGLGSHGQETSPNGTASWEIYDNEFRCTQDNPSNLNYWYQIRGGTGVVTRNKVGEVPWGKTQFQLNVFSITRGANDGAGGSFCPIEYPAPRQTGWSWKDNGANWGKVMGQASVLEGGKSPGYFLPDGKGAVLDPVYFWDNTGPGTQVAGYVQTATYSPDNCGNGQVIGTYLQKGRDYYVDAGAKPGWTAYQYPHPLRSGGPAPTPTSTPSATPTPTASPQPTPTATTTPSASPTPVPTPSPAPTVSYSQWLDQLGDWIQRHPAVPNK
jgi:hypothetical protein